MKALLALAVLTLAACSNQPSESHAKLLDRGCVIKERTVLSRGCGRGGCWDNRGTVYSCPAYEVKLPD